MEEALETALIIDFGSQYTQLIARKIRELGVYSEIVPFNTAFEAVRRFRPKGIVLSGGPRSVYSQEAPVIDKKLFELNIPVLGICYGLQLTAFLLGGKVERADEREYGRALLRVSYPERLFADIEEKKPFVVWMSHADRLEKPPPGFMALANTESCAFAAIADPRRNIYGVQFHPEVAHTENGKKILDNFLTKICGFSKNWSVSSFIGRKVEEIRNRVGEKKVICALSGGVDSSVVAGLLGKAIGKNTKAVFIDNGLLRKNEAEEVSHLFHDGFNFELITVNAAKRFLQSLAAATDPEQKRKIIGNEFIRIFEEKAGELGGLEYLAQGTLYPDVIESVSFKSPSATIKSHHNVGGLPEKMKLKLIEPLRELFKDEVRELGKILGLPESIVRRHPFPGPGLAVRVIGEITEERLKTLREADAVVIEEIRKAGLYDAIWQAFAVLLPIKSVGVMGDERTYENVCVVRAVNSVDGMTADWYRIPGDVLAAISTRIIGEVKGINRVVYDISSKPPSTIEWE